MGTLEVYAGERAAALLQIKAKPSDAPQPRPLICINAWAAKWSISNLVLEQTDKAAALKAAAGLK